jgi:hypothetical protein
MGLIVGEWNNRGKWNMELRFKALNMIINIHSLQGYEKCDITRLCSVNACKTPFTIQVSRLLGTPGKVYF